MGTVRLLATSLERQLNSPLSFKAVSTRVLLRTGVDLRSPKPGQDGDESAVVRVRTALADMGYQV